MDRYEFLATFEQVTIVPLIMQCCDDVVRTDVEDSLIVGRRWQDTLFDVEQGVEKALKRNIANSRTVVTTGYHSDHQSRDQARLVFSYQGRGEEEHDGEQSDEGTDPVVCQQYKFPHQWEVTVLSAFIFQNVI